MLHINVRAQFKSTFSTQPVAPHAYANRRRRLHLFMLMACWALLFLTGMVSAQDVQHTQDKADLSLRSNLRVDPSTLGMSISLPLGNLPGRGSSLPITLNYSSKLWRMKVLNAIENGTGHVKTQVYPEYSERTASGWTASISVPTIELTGNNALYDDVGKGVCQTCALQDPDQIYTYIARINVHMPDGSSHELR